MSHATRRGFVLGLGALALGLGRVARADAISDALARVARARAGLRTLVGPFTQERTIGLLAARVRSTGTLTLVRPDRLRWELAPPDAVTYWFTPEGLAYRGGAGADGKRSEGHVSPSQSTLAASLEDLRTLLGGDLARLRTRYDLRLVSDGPEGLVFDATPHDPALPIKRLGFGLAPDGAIPRYAELVEGPRDKTRIDFGALQRDVPVDPALVRPPT